ncbi:MAG TPA: HEAT repeat domain-containing protein [Vicinamibacteria bacterium]
MVLLLGPLAASSTEPPVSRLAADLVRLYASSGAPGERWGHPPAEVVLPSGTRVARDAAYRDVPGFVSAARLLLESRRGDDAPLGAWLLSTLPPERAAAAEPVLLDALRQEDARVAFEAARALGRMGGPGCVLALRAASQAASSPEVRAAAAWAAIAVAERHREPRPPWPDQVSLPRKFRRGVSWWASEGRSDGGARSFRELAALGVGWVSIHTWAPRQKSLDGPEFTAANDRFGLRDLEGLVRNAHAAGLRVLYKPHLEMRGFEPTADEVAILRGSDRLARRRLYERIRSQGRSLDGRHNEIEMRSDADWQAWFRNYAEYIHAHARQAEAAGADMFSVGRELDRTVLRREADWRDLIRRIRGQYRGPLTYSANFDTHEKIGFWDALDFIGVSAYFKLSDAADPSLAELALGWDRALAPLGEISRRFDRPVLLTEVGYPAIPGAARAPWREGPGQADVWLQSRLYEAALTAASRRPWIVGAFPWLWEGTAQPPFRDASFSIQGKPAAFILARWYVGDGGGP